MASVCAVVVVSLPLPACIEGVGGGVGGEKAIVERHSSTTDTDFNDRGQSPRDRWSGPTDDFLRLAWPSAFYRTGESGSDSKNE